MAKFSGKVGYVITTETSPGVHVEVPVERMYMGDVLEESFRAQETEHINANYTIGNWFSLLADPYAYAHYSAIRYVRWMGGVWAVREIKNKAPRIHLRIGGLYNGPLPDEPEDEEIETPDPPGVDPGE